MVPDEKIYTITPCAFSVTTPREESKRSIQDLIDEFCENQRLPDLDPETKPDGDYLLTIKVDLANNGSPKELPYMTEMINNSHWRHKWSSDSYYNELIATNGCDDVATLYLMPDEDSSANKKVLRWNVKIIKGTARELNELVYRMNQAQILGPIEILLK